MNDEVPVLEIDSVSKSYGKVVALDGVSLTVERGIVGLAGANGAGKTTLFRAILDLVELDRGTIRVAGHDAQRQSVEARRVIGYLPEELLLYERLTGAEFLRFVAGVKGLDNADERREMFGYFGMEDRRHVLIADYSLGMRKKIALVAALMGSPRLALLDEPLNGLDTESMRCLRLRIAEMAAHGTTFVISSHVMSFVERICQRVVVLDRGRIVADGTPDQLRRQTELGGEPFEDVFLDLVSRSPGDAQHPDREP